MGSLRKFGPNYPFSGVDLNSNGVMGFSFAERSDLHAKMGDGIVDDGCYFEIAYAVTKVELTKTYSLPGFDTTCPQKEMQCLSTTNPDAPWRNYACNSDECDCGNCQRSFNQYYR